MSAIEKILHGLKVYYNVGITELQNDFGLTDEELEELGFVMEEDFSEITLDDIKEGMVLTLRSGEDIIILDDKGSFYTTIEGNVKKDDESLYLLFNNDLTHGQVSEFDVLKVKDKTGKVLFDITNKSEDEKEDEDELDRY